jgi:hypothetical protein
VQIKDSGEVSLTKDEAELLTLALVATNSGQGDLVQILSGCVHPTNIFVFNPGEEEVVRELQRYLPELF